MILNVIEHSYHKNGDQLISKLSIATLRKIEFKIAFTDTLVSASKAKQISRETYVNLSHKCFCGVTSQARLRISSPYRTDLANVQQLQTLQRPKSSAGKLFKGLFIEI